MRHMTMVCVVLLLSMPIALSGQDYATDRGSFILGGAASFSSQGGDLYENADGDRLTTLTVNPYLLYFLSPGFGVGGELAVSRATQGEGDITSLGVGPAVAYFFGDAAATVRPFVEAHASYVSISSDFVDASGWGVGGGAGAAFMLSPTVALTLGGVYEIQNVSVEDLEDQDGDEFRVEAGIAAFIF
jgi:hypothetical protein